MAKPHIFLCINNCRKDDKSYVQNRNAIYNNFVLNKSTNVAILKILR